tara:strand:- start:1111 stop:1524 length:414 start_codon:yes stop_codon:yes gene_type:complete
MDNLVFNNDTRDLNNIWYESHSNLIATICVDLGFPEKSEELVKKYLANKVKIKKIKDPNKPKRSKSCYLFFCDENRTKIINKLKSENSKFKIGEVQRILGNMWKNLSDKEKKPYIDKSLEEKEIYKQKMEEYINEYG